MHTHGVFGLHHHGSCCSSVAAEPTSSCGCCDHSTTPLAEILNQADIQSDHDCSFCKFFKYLNVISTASPAWISQESVDLVVTRHDSLLSDNSISSRARGPPLA